MCCITDKNKNIQELCKSIEERDEQIRKLTEELSAARENNRTILDDFLVFKEKYFKLEENYDQVRQIQNQEIENLKEQIERQKSIENQQLNELSKLCQGLKDQLEEKNQKLDCLTSDYADLLKNSDKYYKEFEKLQTDYDDYKKQILNERSVMEEQHKKELTYLEEEMKQKQKEFYEELAKLNSDVAEKDEMIRQCIKDKESLEEEKNRRIDELNYKIKQIEKVFGQPTITVAPNNRHATLNNEFNADKEQPSTSKAAAVASTSNVAITKPQIRRESVETNSSSASDFIELSSRVRQKKIARPQYNPNTDRYAEQNKAQNYNNRKRGHHHQGLANNSSQASKKKGLHSTASSDENDNDFLIPEWRPNTRQGHYVPETETSASEGFCKSKRSRKSNV
uniref:Uncharacterized protein n=1 Tax=Musca domestica TaxID=7370 RepID=A0A1I8N2Q2_MUSDO